MNIGDYVRTKSCYNGIKKILDIEEYLGIKQYFISEDGDYVVESGIIKSSPNIIDLIEAGDYVNGQKVIALKKDILERNIYFNSKDCSIFTDYELSTDWYFGINDGDIKSILTHEQFASMEYRVDGK